MRFLFDENDFLELLSKISNPNNASAASPISSWGLIKIQLRTRSHSELRHVYEGLHPRYRQSGLDDESQSWFAAERIRVGKKVAAMASVPVSRQLLKRGCPNESRPLVWQTALGCLSQGDERGTNNKQQSCKAHTINPDPWTGSLLKAEFDSLAREVERVELLVDDLVHLDVQSTALDANFFPFEDILDACLMAFTRDTTIPSACGTSQGRESVVVVEPLPPCGVVPFRGLVFYAAPLCYLYEDEDKLYGVFRAMYTQYFCRLHHVSSDSRDIIGLARTFEDLLMSHDPHLFFHMATQIEAPTPPSLKEPADPTTLYLIFISLFCGGGGSASHRF